MKGWWRVGKNTEFPGRPEELMSKHTELIDEVEGVVVSQMLIVTGKRDHLEEGQNFEREERFLFRLFRLQGRRSRW